MPSPRGEASLAMIIDTASADPPSCCDALVIPSAGLPRRTRACEREKRVEGLRPRADAGDASLECLSCSTCRWSCEREDCMLSSLCLGEVRGQGKVSTQVAMQKRRPTMQKRGTLRPTQKGWLTGDL